ncbi:CDP-alcohol phosphatidyltransferase family protein [candidate division KSB1 bacterium]|nr:CDP-alcohol phosphatidyltransferase family protein [candidate division KSB1 bacterium]
MDDKRVFTIPNFISAFRLLFLIPIFFFLKQDSPTGNFWAMFFMVLAIITDNVDGYLAKKLNQVSYWGKIIDPVSDKVCIAVVIIFLTFLPREIKIPIWFVVLVLGRDLAILSANFLVIRLKNTVGTSNKIGQRTAIILALVIILYTLGWEPYCLIMMWIGVVMIAVSLTSYFKVFLNLMKSPPDKYRKIGNNYEIF